MKISSLIINSEITPFMALTLFIVYNLKTQSEQNKKDIKRLEEEMKEDAKKKTEEEVKRLKEELKRNKDEILVRAKNHGVENAKASLKYIKELNDNFKKYGDHLTHIDDDKFN